MAEDDERRLLEARFDAGMLEIYQRAGQSTGYWANYFRRDVLAKGGLITARQLLAATGTSKGFDRLKAERRLDLSVEALVLRPEFERLFTGAERDRARARLDRHGYRSPEEGEGVRHRPRGSRPELDLLLASVEAAQPGDRMELRDAVVAHRDAARDAMGEWLSREHLPGFAIAVLERQAATDPLATRVIEAYAMRGGRDQRLATAALDRLQARRTDPQPTKTVTRADVYRSTGVPEAAFGVGCEVTVQGRPCSNPGRHPVDGRIMCTTHRKSWELAQARKQARTQDRSRG